MEYQKAKQKVDERNAIRQRAGLPLLDPESELVRTMKDAAQEEYRQFCEKHTPQVKETVMKEWYKSHTNPPNFISGMGIGAKIRNILKKMWEEQNAPRI